MCKLASLEGHPQSVEEQSKPHEVGREGTKKVASNAPTAEERGANRPRCTIRARPTQGLCGTTHDLWRIGKCDEAREARWRTRGAL